MNFTRDPLIETVITPKEGFKLVIRSSKGGAQEEFFVDSVEVISFGKHCFYRSLEKPKSFVVPVGDYEILEVREARMILKTPTLEKGIKIAGGKEKGAKTEAPLVEVEAAAKEQQKEKRREKRRTRKRKEKVEEEVSLDVEAPIEIEKRPSLIPPPPTLIREKKEEKSARSSEDEEAPQKEETPEKKSKRASGNSSKGENPNPQEEESKQEELPF
ncbi:MAG: hypothetical protein K940chlam9_01019 [Chlamydiae bacterium]|nr:hypothetical protein [Chlamydiota bacterium]